MKKEKQKSGTGHGHVPRIGRLSVLVSALTAAGLLLLALPACAAAPLPVPCGGCGNFPTTTTPINFQQAGIVNLTYPNSTNLTINQKTQTAILNWQSFNIDSGYSVVFNQPSSTASALNKIWDSNPSTIAGSLSANGQVYLVNQNGIIFANGAQVNTGTLIASSLSISDSQYQAGYLTNVSATPDFIGTGGFVRVDTGAVLNGSRIMLFAPVVQNNGIITTPDGQAVLAAGNNVYLEASQDPNLRGVLVEVDVTNPGASDPALAGQVQNNSSGTVTNAALGNILAQRGNITLVGYAVNQQGLLSATTAVNENGTIKLEARYNVYNAANYPGTYNAQTTSNGYLAQSAGVASANDIRATKTGDVTLASGSAITIAPETSSTATLTASQGFNPSIVEVMGSSIDMQSGSSIVAPGGKVTLAAIGSYDPVTGAGLNPSAIGNNVYRIIDSSFTLSSFLNPNYLPAHNPAGDTARVFLDSGSTIDVSGSTAAVSVARDILAVQLRGAELADSPLQKTGPLYGQTVYVDMRQGTPFVNYSGEEAQIQKGVAELTSTGGNVNLYSTGDVVTKSGSAINLSGGQVDYTGAYVNTTNLISNGVSYNIANASPNLVYSSIAGTYILSSAKWGVTQTFNTMSAGDIRGRWDPGYVQGQSAGLLTVLAPSAALDGGMIAKTVAGAYQNQPYVNPASLATDNYQNTWQMLPQGGTLVIGDSNPVPDINNNKVNYITDSNVNIQAGAPLLASGFVPFDSSGNANPLPASFQQTISLDANMFGASTGLNNLDVYSNKTVSVATGTSLTLAPGGSVSLQGDTVNMEGSIYAPSGTVTLAVTQITASSGTAPGGITVGSAGGSTISTRGTWVNDLPLLVGTAGSTTPAFINGGNVTINSGGNLSLAAGTVIDASGGAMVDTSKKIHGGNGGAISITGNYSVGKNPINGFLGTPYQGQLDHLDLMSYGAAGGKGGSLTINAGDIVIGGTGPNAPSSNTLSLPAGFFSNGGFTSYTLGATGGTNGLLVAPGSVIAPKNQTLIPDNSALQAASGTDIYSFSQPGELPDWLRNPVSITLKQTGGGAGSLTVGGLGEGETAIQVDPKASINLVSDSQLTVFGTLDAPAGNINLTLNSAAPQNNNFNGTSTIWLGSQSELLTPGATVMTPNANGLQQGQVLSGGGISLASNMFVVTQPGSLMNVSGTAANLDLPQLVSGLVMYRNSLVAGNAGSIAIKSTEGALLLGAMKAGVAPGSTAAAGSFSLTLAGMQASDRINLTTFPQNPLWELLVEPYGSTNNSQVSPRVQVSFASPGSDSVAGSANLTAMDGMAFVDPSSLQSAGFDAVTLRSSYGPVVLGNPNVPGATVTLDARRSVMLDAPVIALTGNSAGISASYVDLANSNVNNQSVTQPLAGTGALNVTGQLVDLTGDVSISGAGQVSIASSGDIRLNGVFNAQNSTNSTLDGQLTTQGNVTLQANQVYPTTMSQFTVSVVDGLGNPAGAITVKPDNPASPASGSTPVLSAGGQVTLSAFTINQDGVFKAPMGAITLGVSTTNGSTQNVNLGTGSLTSVSADGLIIPFGTMLGGTGWVYNLAGAASVTANSYGNVTLFAPPQKQISIQGNNVAIQSGAVVNLKGGGDLYAYEFIPGTGGSVNVLDPTQGPANTYAIIPGLSTFAPYDPQLAGQYAASASKSPLGVGSTVYLSGGDGLSAGYYALLPASYALLPGAYTVTMVSGHQDMLPGQGVIQLTNGADIMAGKLAVAGTGIPGAVIQDARWSGFEVAHGSLARTESQFQDSYASTFYKSQAAANGTPIPNLPADAGQLVVTANGSGATLALDGTFVAQPGAGGQGAQVDLNVVGGGFDIVNTAGTGATGLVELTTGSLNALGAESLLIGGVRSQSTGGTAIAVGASNVQVDNAGSVLGGPEIILAATNGVTVNAGSSIAGSGTFTGQANNITIGSTGGANGDGALLRVSSGPQVTVARNNISGAASALSVASGAAVGGSSVLLDSSSATTIGSGAALSGSSFSVSAQNIAIGAPASTPASTLLLSSNLLNQLANFGSLTLHSYNDIDFYGAASLGGPGAGQSHLINSLTLNATSINGFNNAGMNDVIDASTVTLMNSNSSAAPAAQYTAGSLAVNAGNILMAGGNLAIQGFNGITLNASGEIIGTGGGTGASGITVISQSGDASAHVLQANAGQITGSAGSNLSITDPNSNYDISLGLNTGNTFASADTLGANITVTGKSISGSGIINIPTGSVTLNATGPGSGDGVTLAAGSEIIASGVARTIAGQTAYAPAGSVKLSSANGGITLQNGSVIDVSANAGGGNAGSIVLTAANGPVTVSGTLSGEAPSANGASGTGGSITVDAGSLAGTDNSSLTALNDTLTAGGFNYLRDIRVRTGDLVLAADTGAPRAAAQNYTLEADSGNIDVLGTVNASGSNGGSILLAAQGNVALESTALLDAHSTGAGQAGGSVTIESQNGSGGTNGINLMTGSSINVGNGAGSGGSELLRAPQINGYTDVAVNQATGTGINVSSGASVTVEAYRQYTATSLAASNLGTTSVYFTNAQAFANTNAAAIKNRLGMSLSDPNMHLTPGLEIDSTGDLTLTANTTNINWDLHNWRFNNGAGALTETGILTLRAAGNLNINYSISDGFTTATSSTLFAGPSWSYRLVAGADMTAANVMAVNNTGATGNVTLAAGKETLPTSSNKVITATMDQVRTGTGFIDVAAGGSVNLGNRDSAIYTAGVAATGVPSYTYNGQSSVFPTGGGSINIAADGNINGDSSGTMPVNELVSEWQWRQGQAASNGAYIAPAWWINYGAFRQNIGALGGGNVNITAGGNINTLSAVVPASGYVDSGGNTVVLGGGNLNVTAGGSINSGIFYVGNGQGTLEAGSMGASRFDTSNKPIYTILLLGGSLNNVQTGFNVQTAGDLTLQTVLNPTMLGPSFSQKPANSNISFFYTYDSAGNISLASLDGNIRLVNTLNSSNNASQASTTPFFMNTPQATNVYPASLEITALNGGISSGAGSFDLFPSSTGNLQLFAAANISLGGGFGMSDMSPASFLPANSAGGTGHAPAVSVTSHGTFIDSAGQIVPVHANDATLIAIVAGGDVTGTGNTDIAILELPKQTLISAGQDIINVSADVQNQQSTDTTSFVAGRDISFNSSGTSGLGTAGITVSGPGQVILQAGRNVNLGVSNGVVTEGSLNNPALPSQGANITILPGTGQSGADTTAFIGKYIDPAASATYGADLVAYVENYGAPQNQTPAQAFIYFNTLTKALQEAFVNQVLFNELRASGRSAISTGNYSAGYAAIAALFPGSGSPASGYAGDLTLYNSQVKTVSGGDINILTPGGGVNAGLASANTGKPASDIGVVTVGGGNVNAYVNNDFTVNQSRVFTIQGGNILMWSSWGNLDAGNGSKTATSTPPPLLVVNPKTGEFSVDATASIVGSGIRVLLGNANVVPGTVDLYAPTGVINAGDAGIASAGNINLGAQQVIGASNINFGGVAAGVPVATAAPVTVSGAGNLQDANKAASQATQGLGNTDMANADDFMPTFLSVDVIGLGDSCSASKGKKDCP